MEGKDKKPKKTFNQLDERFQLNPEHDPNHIFEEEYEMIKELRKNPSFSSFDDKFLATFLCARRHKMDEVKELLTRHIQVRDKLGFDKTPPSYEDVKHFLGKSNVRVNGYYDIHNRMVYYYFIEYDLPKERETQTFWKFAFWDCYDTIQNEPLSVLRNGSIFIVDMQNFGWKNLDLSSKGREINQSLTSVFPRRIRALYVVNAGTLFKAAMKFANLVLPKKLIKRIKVVTAEELSQIIPNQTLHPKYGGSLKVEMKT